MRARGTCQHAYFLCFCFRGSREKREEARLRRPLTLQFKRRIMHLLQALIEAGRNGMGMFIESYFLFSIGNILPIWQVQYPQCFTNHFPNASQCSNSDVTSITYVEVSFVIIGMLFFGYLGDSIGRKRGLRLVAVILFLGSK